MKSNLINKRLDNEKSYDSYHLTTSMQEKESVLSATVVLSQNCHSLIRQKHLEIIDNDGFACDHARIIAQGLLYIEALLKQQRKEDW